MKPLIKALIIMTAVSIFSLFLAYNLVKALA